MDEEQIGNDSQSDESIQGTANAAQRRLKDHEENSDADGTTHTGFQNRKGFLATHEQRRTNPGSGGQNSVPKKTIWPAPNEITRGEQQHM
jgi:hypothetical protein